MSDTPAQSSDQLASTKAQLDAYEALDRYRERTRRVYHFREAVSDESVDKAMRWLDRAAERSQEPITFRIASHGGSILDGLALFDHIRGLDAAGIEVTTYAAGSTASMGTVLMQAGTTRVAAPNAYLHAHEAAQWAGYGKLHAHEERVAHLDRLNEHMLALLASRSKLTVRKLRTLTDRREVWWSAAEALKLGLVDEVRL